MKVRELISFESQPFTIRSDDTLESAGKMMLARGIRHLPVVDGMKLVGILSERDLLAFRGYGGLKAPVRNAMQSPVQTMRPDDDVDDAADRISNGHIGSLPVVEDGRVVGIITSTDLLSNRARHPDILRPTMSGRVMDAMSRNPQVAHLDDFLLDAVGRMTNDGIRHLPVVDVANQVLGMLSDRDVRRTLGDISVFDGEDSLRLRVRQLRVGDVATLAPMTVSQDASIADAVHLFVDNRIGALPVIDEGGKLVGILSYIDVLKYLAGEGRAAGKQSTTQAPARQ